MYRVLISENGRFFTGGPEKFRSMKSAERYGTRLVDRYSKYSKVQAFAVVDTRLRPDVVHRFSWEMVKSNAKTFVDLAPREN